MKNKNKQTKFPVARIKKIMQKDEEVGKVAQATPVVISKALELFLGLIVDEASKVTKARGSKKVEAYHLKHAVDTTEMLDFLKEIVEAVPDPSAGGTIDLEAENAEKKKRAKGKRAAVGPGGEAAPKRRRRKKGEAEQDAAAGGEGRGSGDEMKVDPEAEAERDDEDDDDEDTPYNGGNSRYRPRSPTDDDDWQ
ncbi:histone-fold-containing protein, partial [Crucibulum laeve]